MRRNIYVFLPSAIALLGVALVLMINPLPAGGPHIARPGDRIMTPANGYAAQAGHFRSYGKVLIINAGQGCHYILSGMGRIDVKDGEIVREGEIIGAMAVNFAPCLYIYVEPGKNGHLSNPAIWWQEEKAPMAMERYKI